MKQLNNTSWYIWAFAYIRRMLQRVRSSRGRPLNAPAATGSKSTSATAHRIQRLAVNPAKSHKANAVAHNAHKEQANA